MKHTFKGLTDEQVTESRLKFGSNQLHLESGETFWDKLYQNFKDPIIIILSFALVVIFALSLLGLTEWYEAAAIAVAVRARPWQSVRRSWSPGNSRRGVVPAMVPGAVPSLRSWPPCRYG